MKMIVKSHITKSTKEFVVNDRDDLLKLAANFNAVHVVENSRSVQEGLKALAKYISKHHLSATVLDDTEEPENMNRGVAKVPQEAESIEDLEHLEDDAEEIDMPDEVVIRGATHRWGNQ